MAKVCLTVHVPNSACASLCMCLTVHVPDCARALTVHVHVLSEVSSPISLQRLQLHSKLCADSESEANNLLHVHKDASKPMS